MKEEPLCSVCIANYNGEEYLENCIDSVLSQDADFTIEILVHDDASSDGSVDLILKKYPQVILIQSAENVGFCVSNNRMVEKASGEFILLLNNDAALHLDALKTLVEAHKRYGKGIYGLPQYNMDSKELIDIGSLFDPFLNPIPNTDPKRRDVGMIIGACLFISKELWQEFEGFPTWFGSLAEDMYLCCAARIRGYHVKAIPYSGFNHWVGRSFGGGKVTAKKRLSSTFNRRAISERNKSFVMVLVFPWISFWVLFPLHLICLLVEGAVISLFKYDIQLLRRIYLNCLKELWVMRRVLLEKRKEFQKNRRISVLQFFTSFSWLPHKLILLLKYGVPLVK